jgi:TrmH family RNA methyltransferase
MGIINSKENKNYKLCQQLASKKYRDQLGLYLIEGPNLLKEALENQAEIQLVLLCDAKEGTLRHEWMLRHEPMLPEGKTYHMEEKLFEKLAQTETSQGVLAVVQKPDMTRPEILDRMFSPGANLVVLDRLQDPGNIGTIIRTADGAGYQGVVVIKGTGDVYSPKVIRAAAGSVFRMPVLFLESPAQAMNILKEHGKRIVTTSLDAEVRYFDIELKENIGLIIGNEGNGVCLELKDGSDVKIKIPMTGKIESLNAAVAAGIVMYEAMRK